MTVFPLFYAGNIHYFQRLLQSSNPLIELYEHYPKQTYRNRMEILGPNGIHRLSIPVKKTGLRMTTNDICIGYEEHWQKDHWKGLEAAYRRSAYFEYYEDRLRSVYVEKPKRLVDLNLRVLHFILESLDCDPGIQFTTEYMDLGNEGDVDYRDFDFSKPSAETGHSYETYFQVFSDRHPFVANLSILDALFNLGPSTRDLVMTSS